MHTAHALEMECHTLFNASTLTTPTFCFTIMVTAMAVALPPPLLIEAGRVAKGIEVVELFVGGLAVEELEVDDRVAAVEAGRLTEGVYEKVAEGVDERIEQFVGGCILVVPLINSIISSQKNSLVIEMLTNYDIK